MCNGTWVCFDCRTAVRRPTWRHVTNRRPSLIGLAGRVRCPSCHGECKFLGPSIEIPPKRKVQSWRNLQKWVEKHRAEAVDSEYRKLIRRRHKLEQQISELRARPANDGREELITKLKQQLAECF